MPFSKHSSASAPRVSLDSVSALPELEEKPFKTRRKVTIDGWDKEEEGGNANSPPPDVTWAGCTESFAITWPCVSWRFLNLHSLMFPSTTLTTGTTGSGARTSKVGPLLPPRRPCFMQREMPGGPSATLSSKASRL